VPDIDDAYRFDRDTTLAILAGFAHNRRVMIQGYHGTGKSTHIEQVAARLNWPCIRVNLDSHISRIDLIGKDAIVLRDGKQVTEFREGILPWALQHACALVFDEYDAGRPDVMFVIQRVLEVVRQADAARPEQGDPPASGVPAVLHRQHGGPRRHDRPLSRHAADQSGPDGPLEHRRHAELSAARRMETEIVLAKMGIDPNDREGRSGRKHGGAGRPHAPASSTATSRP
jgi:cobaltochelatase CobS